MEYRLEKPIIHLLSKIRWQLFTSLTFRQEKLPERVRLSMYFRWARDLAGWHSVYFPSLVWALRMENGEITGRLHFHALIAGLPQHAVQEKTCFAAIAQWQKIAGRQVWRRVKDDEGNYVKLAEVEKNHLGGRYQLEHVWEGGFARCAVFDPSLGGEDYIVKCLGVTSHAAGDVYESAKFASDSCNLMLSHSLFEVAGARWAKLQGFNRPAPRRP